MGTHNKDGKLFTLKEMESAVKNTFDAVHYHHQHPDTFPAVSEFDCYEKFIPKPATPPTPVSRTAEDIEQMAESFASEFYDKDSERTSAMPECTQWENRKHNWQKGFKAAMELIGTQPEKR